MMRARYGSYRLGEARAAMYGVRAGRGLIANQVDLELGEGVLNTKRARSWPLRMPTLSLAGILFGNRP